MARGLFAGLATLDVVHRLPAALGTDEKITARRQDIAAGGPAANAAVTFAALGGRATLVTALGSSAIGRAVADELTGRSVDVVDVAAGAAVDVGVSAIRVIESTGERSVSSGDAAGISVSAPDLSGLVDQADVVLVDGHHPGLALGAAGSARQLGVPVLLDGGSWKPVLDDLLGLVDFAICSAVFALPDGRPVAETLLARGVSAVAVTHGGAAVHWATPDGQDEVPVPHVRATDTLGAGDAFHGAAARAIAALGAGPALATWPAVLTFATRVASVRVRHIGPRDWLKDPELAELAVVDW